MRNGEALFLKITQNRAKHGVKRAAIFGSHARNEENDNSDIEIIIEFNNDEKKSLLDLIAPEQEISEILNIKTDVITYDSLSPYLKDDILTEQEPVYG